ncbi:unnamed protein product [Candidula unifasciata]|uniref:NADH dehydrogenase [ubiquinone] 1 beta subcomplex subunit 10 n=1 Tax=Candidula unifasciata TaxID=100452 RepID=A0A8S3ZLS8_9EUPU|nr:unnamed protein product [Candidula unifasciata]
MGGHDGSSGEECHEHQVAPPLRDKFETLALGLFKAIDSPVTFFREKVVLPLQTRNNEKFYHRRFSRVPTVDNCDFEDPVCVYEADEQYFRDKLVDSNILKILRQRKVECEYWEGPDASYKCRKFVEDYEDASTNWFIKYGDIKTRKGAIEAYMKQKHRLIWERRNPDKPLH